MRLGGLVAALFICTGTLGAADAAAGTEAAAPAAPGKSAKDRTLRDFSPDCLRAGCHGQLNETPWVHGPVAIGSCDVCHRALPAGEHKYELARTKEAICTYCHRMAEGKFAHKVVTDSGCTKCHNPHGGAKRNLLVTQDVAKLCGECHDPTRPLPLDAEGKPRKASEAKDRQDLPTHAKLHEPVAKGNCLACHETHNANHEARLVDEQQKLCVACHKPIGKSLAGATRVHKPVTEKCTKCHVAHGGSVDRLLSLEPKALCLSCHKPVADSLATGFVVRPAAAGAAPDAPPAAADAAAPAATETRMRLHDAIRDAPTCLVCHEPHASVGKTLTHARLDEACYSCHDKEIRMTAPDHVIPNVKQELARAPFHHRPVADGRCAECHLGHASPNTRLLTHAFPIGLYVPFSEEAYALCFACHDRRLATEGRGVRTGFRDGDRNLHFVHIMDEEPGAQKPAPAAAAGVGERDLRKGRSCGICHAPHGSTQAKQIRESVQYGPEGWQLAIRFEQTPTGGRCTAACHKPKSYNNQQPPAPPKEPPQAKP